MPTKGIVKLDCIGCLFSEMTKLLGRFFSFTTLIFFYYYYHLPQISMQPTSSTTPTRTDSDAHNRIWVEGVMIVGAGPAGLATSASLQEKGIPSLIFEKSDCIASLWRYRTYDSLVLHTPKQFCHLPGMPLPPFYPTYPTRLHLLHYLDHYATHFQLRPLFNHCVVSAAFDLSLGLWQVQVRRCISKQENQEEQEEEEICYMGRWLVVATGENAIPIIPSSSSLPGIENYRGHVTHSSHYRNGESLSGKKVLVVGCGNSGIEVAMDLALYSAKPFIVISTPVHVLPRDILGYPTFAISMWLMQKKVSVKWIDRLLLWYSHIAFGDTCRWGIPRPNTLGPLEMKQKTGSTPLLLDATTLAFLHNGDIQVMGGVESFTSSGCYFRNNQFEEFDAIILATGYKSSVSTWLKEDEMFPRDSYGWPINWKGRNGLYASGFTRQGLLGVAMDAQRIANDIKHDHSLESPTPTTPQSPQSFCRV